ncbi:MAG: dethiobiotin synthase [Sulfurimicrobium sp.]|nr:dethiobiotin synthase [Sulfurimicrobium sp.]
MNKSPVPLLAKGLFVTGTDTGVGKTLISCALLHAYAAMGNSTVGMKPVAAGCEPYGSGLRCEDVELLRHASSVQAPIELVNPYAFAPPVAPHVAAAEVGVTIALERIRLAYMALTELADKVVVEGVGGFRVPLDEHSDTADLAQLLDLPVVLVVGMRLGCLSHALLTVEAIAARGLPLAGWVANRVDPEMAGFDANLQALQRRIVAPLLGVVAYAPLPDAARVAQGLLLPLLGEG